MEAMEGDVARTDPELRLPFRKPKEIHSESSTSIQKSTEADSTSEQLPSKTPSITSGLKDANIHWLYLTYETELPRPSNGFGKEPGERVPPDCPDLSQFTNPLDWSDFKKSFLIWLSSIATAITAYGAGAYVPGTDQMSDYWGKSHVVILVGVTLFTAGFGVAPMVLAPFSEINGRRPVFLIAGFLFFVFVLCCGITRLFAGMLLCRFLAGCASSTFSTMVGGVVSDIYVARHRNKPMVLFTTGVLFGTGVGPLVSGILAYNLSWRWIFYVHAIMVFLLSVALIVFFKETRGTVLLSRKAKKLNEWYEAREASGFYGFEIQPENTSENRSGHQSQRLRWKVKADEDRESLGKMITISLVRPFKMLITEPVVFFFSLWVSFAWAVLYSTFSAVPYMFETVYGFNLQQSNAVLASISIAGILSTFLSLNQERVARRFGKYSETPEGRLYYACYFSFLLPIGLLWFGWTSSANIPWIVPCLAVGCATMGIFSIYLAVFNYLADCYGPYASSAIAAQSFCRNLLGGAFPLFTEQMYRGLGFGGGGSLMGGIALVLTIVPWVLAFYGPKIRASSKLASQLMKT